MADENEAASMADENEAASMADENEAASMAENNGEKIESTINVAIVESSWDTIADSKRSDSKKAEAKKQSLQSILLSALSVSKTIHFEYVISNFFRRVRGRIPRLAGSSLTAATRNVPPATLSKNFQLRIEGKIKLKLKGRLLLIWLLLHREGKEALKEVSRWRVILFFASCFVVSCMYFHAASFRLDPKVTDRLFSLHGMPKHRLIAGVGRFQNVYMAHPKAAK